MLTIDIFDNDAGKVNCAACRRKISRGEEVVIYETSIGLRLACGFCRMKIELAMDAALLTKFEEIRLCNKEEPGDV